MPGACFWVLCLGFGFNIAFLCLSLTFKRCDASASTLMGFARSSGRALCSTNRTARGIVRGGEGSAWHSLPVIIVIIIVLVTLHSLMMMFGQGVQWFAALGVKACTVRSPRFVSVRWWWWSVKVYQMLCFGCSSSSGRRKA